MSGRPASDDGFTLIEVVISLALFALVGLAGFSLLSSVLGIQHRTEGRLDVMGQTQRAMIIFGQDFQQLTDGPRLEAGNVMVIGRTRSDAAPLTVQYRLSGQRFERVLGTGGEIWVQPLLDGVADLSWDYFDGSTWRTDWSALDAPELHRPVAVALNLHVKDASMARPGLLRRVIPLPAAP